MFYNGLFFLLISITGVREKIIAGVPRALQIGLQAGIGMFIAFFGLKNAGIIVGNPNTLVTAGDITSPECLFALCGIALVSILTCKKFRPAIIATIALMTLVAFFATDSQGRKMAQIPDAIFSLPHGISETFMQLDWAYPFRDFRRAMPVILMLLFLDLFDTIATVVALGRPLRNDVGGRAYEKHRARARSRRHRDNRRRDAGNFHDGRVCRVRRRA